VRIPGTNLAERSDAFRIAVAAVAIAVMFRIPGRHLTPHDVMRISPPERSSKMDGTGMEETDMQEAGDMQAGDMQERGDMKAGDMEETGDMQETGGMESNR
jgi:hypothetical protein